MVDREDVVLVYSTFPDDTAARRLGGELVRRRYVACVNLIPGMRSIYRWRGEIAEDDEVVMIAKTRAGRAAEVVRAITEGHPYETPAVMVLPTVGGSSDYIGWILQETAAEDP